jgi:hypothetical protein
MAVLPWPPGLNFTSWNIGRVMPSRSGGVSLSGLSQDVVSDAGYWRMSVAFDMITRDRHLIARAFDARMNGQAGRVLMPFNDCRFAPAADYAPLPATSGLWSGGADWSDGSRWHVLVHVAGTAAAAARRATSIAVTMAGSPRIRSGQYFGIGERAYQITDVAGTMPNLTLQFWPPLREAVTAGTEVAFDHRVVCKMKFANAEGLDLGQTLATPIGRVTAEFVEDPA